MPLGTGNQNEHKLTPRLSLNCFAQFIGTVQGPAFLSVRPPPFSSIAGVFESIGHTFIRLRVGRSQGQMDEKQRKIHWRCCFSGMDSQVPPLLGGIGARREQNYSWERPDLIVVSTLPPGVAVLAFPWTLGVSRRFVLQIFYLLCFRE